VRARRHFGFTFAVVAPAIVGFAFVTVATPRLAEA
jgi:hypothetical protein